MRPKTWMDVQIAVLAAGMLFAWSIVATDLYWFTLTGGELTQFAGTALPNPLITSCFYAAIVLTVALRWAIHLQRRNDARRERHLAWLLLAGTLLALGSLGYECYWSFAPRPPGGASICTGGALFDPLETPCFVGLLFFVGGLASTLAVARSTRRHRVAVDAASAAAGSEEPVELPVHHRVS